MPYFVNIYIDIYDIQVRALSRRAPKAQVPGWSRGKQMKERREAGKEGGRKEVESAEGGERREK